MVQVSFALGSLSRDQHLLNGAGQGEGHFGRFGGEESVAQILLVQADGVRKGLKLRAMTMGGLGIENGVAREAPPLTAC